MHKYFAYIIFTSTILLISCSAFRREGLDDPKTWKYFRIYASTEDDSLLIKLQKELLMEPLMENYSIVVDLRDKNPIWYSFVISDGSDPFGLTTSTRYAWSNLSLEIKNGLINWTGSNKENLTAKK